jgi:hypothetical protein
VDASDSCWAQGEQFDGQQFERRSPHLDPITDRELPHNTRTGRVNDTGTVVLSHPGNSPWELEGLRGYGAVP